MNKDKLIKLLENYNSKYLEEREYKKQIIDFLKKNHIFEGKTNENGHITASAWIINEDRSKTLMTHHYKLDKWLQLGGHTEEEEEVLESALREAREESGLLNLNCLHEEIFDLDVHIIPERKSEKEHFHYDIRFILEADSEEKLEISSESKDLCWVQLDKVHEFSQSQSILRMVEKTYKMRF